MFWDAAPRLHIAVDAGTGPPVVLLHGIASSSVTFEHLLPLVAGDHRVIAIDLLGFGGSPPGEHYTIEEHVEAVHATIRSLRLRDPFVLVGHSLGSLVATRYAARHPRGLSKLVLVSPPVYLPPETVGDRRDRAAMELYDRLYDFLRANKQFTMAAGAGLALLSPIRGLLDVTEDRWPAFALSLEHAIQSQTTIADLASVRVPVELVYGALDPLLAPAGIRILEQLRNVTAHRVHTGDHVIRPSMARVVAAAVGP
ncbi:MAG TPA: alpha/beta hydrolase [Rhodoglobus sp.]|nr:alpha/beta hydrolase [Rhodoglobus sp.]